MLRSRWEQAVLLGPWLALCACEQPAPVPGEPPPVVQAERKAPDTADPGVLAAAAGQPLAAPSERAQCAQGMLLVEGMYCPVVEQTCLRYLTPYGRYAKFRCAEYAESSCLSEQRRPLRFCIDRDEYAKPGEQLPANHQSFSDAQRICASQGKRVCTEGEWNFACEGEQLRPYPYGQSRDPSACNSDRLDILTPGRALRDLRAPADSFPRCVSPFGVRNLAGNIEEFVAEDGSDPQSPVMKGAYWLPGRNACRSRQTVHGRHYQGTETGFRCCAEPVVELAER